MLSRAVWLGAYALLCALSLLVGWAKDYAEEKVRGKPKDKDPPKEERCGAGR